MNIPFNIDQMIAIACSYHPKEKYLHGGCYAFAKTLSILFNGEIYINTDICHCVAKIDGSYYDIHGRVKHTDNYHLFRKKEERVIAKTYIIKSATYTQNLIQNLVDDYIHR